MGATFAGVSGRREATSTRTSRPIVVGGVPEHFNLPWKLAIEQGAFAAAGLDVRFVDEPAGTGALTAALGDGSLDLATVLTEGLVAALDRGLAAHLDRVYVASPLVWGIHAPAAQAGCALAALPHGRIAISRRGSGSHLMAYVLAAANGWRLDDESFVVVRDLAGGVDALAHGHADVFLWETFMTKPHVDAGTIARVGELPTPWPGFVVARRRGFGAARAAAVLDALAPVVRAFAEDPATPALVASRIGGTEADARAWLARTRYGAGERLSSAACADVRAVLAAAGVH